jgi:hypothetical protein
VVRRPGTLYERIESVKKLAQTHGVASAVDSNPGPDSIQSSTVQGGNGSPLVLLVLAFAGGIFARHYRSARNKIAHRHGLIPLLTS